MKRTNLYISIFIVIIILGFIYLKSSSSRDRFIPSNKTRILNIELKEFVSGILVPEKEIKIKSQISGILKKIYHKAGDTIKAGEIIAEVSILPNPQSIEQAKKTVKTVNIRFAKAKKEYINYTKLYKQEIIAEQEFDKYKDVYLLSKEELESAKKQLQIIQQGYTNSETNIPNFIRSTVNGTILSIPVKEGCSITEMNNFNEGTTLASIADLSNLIFKAKVNESDVVYLKKGMSFEIGISALRNKKLKATLNHISPKAIEENGIMKFEIEAKVENSDHIKLYPGFSAVAKIILDKREKVLCIKERNIIFAGDSLFVEVLDSNYVKTKRKIKIGLSNGLRVEILDGLSINERVIVQ